MNLSSAAWYRRASLAGYPPCWADMGEFLGDRRRMLLALAAWLATAPAYAHRPYEYVDASLTDASGRQLYLVKAFTDGIILPDPARVIVRDAMGSQLAETPMRDDMAIVCRSKHECLVFGWDASSSVVFPSDVWKVTGPYLSPIELSVVWRVVGFGLHVSRSWFGYLAALGAVFLPVVAFLWSRHIRRRAIRTALLVVVVTGGVGWLCLVTFIVQLSYLSLPILSLFAALPGGALWIWRPRCLGCGPTRLAPDKGAPAEWTRPW